MNPRLIVTTSCAALALSGSLTAGCLGIATTSDIRETPGDVRSRSSQGTDRRSTVRARIEGTVLKLGMLTEATCYDESYQVVHRTEYLTREISDSSWPWYVLEWTCGVACTLGGVGAFGYAPFASSETTSPTGEQSALSDQAISYIGGAAGVAVGVVTLVLAIADSVRAIDGEQQLEDTERVLNRNPRSCDSQPLPGAAIEILFAQWRFLAGSTGPDGTLAVDLRGRLPPSVVAAAPGTTMLTLLANGSEVGTVDLSAYLATVDAEAWAAAQSAATTDAYARYLREYPRGAYAAEAARLLDERAWMAVQAESTADAMSRYLSEQPQGEHADEALAWLDDDDWRSAESEGTVESFTLYLDAHPAGTHGPTARTRVTELLIDDGDLADAEVRIAEFLSANAEFQPEADRLLEKIAESRRQAERRVARAIEQAVSASGRCSGQGAGSDDVQVAADAYRKLFSVRAQASRQRIQDTISDIMARCICSPECAGVR